MINIKKIPVFVLIMLIVLISNFNFSSAYYSENINFRSLTIEDGLSQSTVETIIQDSKGYIWIGTNDGLNKYNGYNFDKYSYDINDENSLSSNYIVDIVEDNDGFIWVSTTDGLNKINPSTNKITKYFSSSADGSLSNNRICELLVTSKNKILVTTSDGLNLYDSNTDSFKRILGNNSDLPSQYIHSIEEDIDNNIWLGTENGLVKLDENLNLVTTINNDNINGISDNPIFKIYSDNKKELWVATFGSGLFKIDPSTLKYSHYSYTSDNNYIPDNVVKDIIKDSNNNLWIATYNGIAKYDESNDKFIIYQNNSYDRNSLINNKTYTLMEDKSGLIWVGTYKGISTFNPDNKFKHYKSDPFSENALSENIIHGIFEDDKGYMWIGTASNGVNILSNDNNKIKFINQNNSNLCDNAISDINGYKNEIYIGTNNGLSIVNTDSNKIYNLNTDDNLPSNSIKSLFVDSKNNLWIGTKRGLAIMNISTKEILNITDYLEKNGVSDLFIRDIYETKDGYYYLACFLDGGLIEINPTNNQITIFNHIKNSNNSLTTNSIRSITEDINGNLIIGTSHGLNILNRKTNKFTNYTVKDGLPNNNIYGILIDDNNNIWMSTNSGISKFNPTTKVFENFTIIDGLQDNEFNGKSYFKDSQGYFYFGGINGFNKFKPEDIYTSSFYPTVVFDEFQVEGIDYKDISNLEFKSSENNISLSFFLNDYKNLNGTQYYYKLEGLDENWISTNSNKIVYGNLAPGSYTFKIKASSYNGLVSSVSSISFHINPPFWRSHTAIFMYLLIIIFICYLNISKVKRLDKLVDNRTKELKHEMQKNKNLFKKIIKLEKNKNNYFVNLSHELRTPLNVLNGTVQLIKNLNNKNDLSSDQIDYYMDIMTRNCNRLLNIINNIIDTSKLQSNNYVINKKTEDIVYVVEETILGLKDYIENKGIEFTIDTTVEEKLIQCDKYEIERCIVNLIGNAVKFTSKGGKIDVFINDLGSSVEISVADTGIGISEENMKIIFDKFNQVIDTSSEIKGGSGLGLTITKHLVKLHGGEIKVESELNKGSKFTIILPS